MICYICENSPPSVFVPAAVVFHDPKRIGDVAICPKCYRLLRGIAAGGKKPKDGAFFV